MLLFVLYVTPGAAAMVAIWRLVKSRTLVTVARVDAARAGARLEGAERAAELAEAGRADAAGAAREALGQLGEALAVARGVEQVGLQVQGLTDYLVARIDGEAARRDGGPAHAARAVRRGRPAGDHRRRAGGVS